MSAPATLASSRRSGSPRTASGSRASITDRAEMTEISCSAERPPKSDGDAPPHTFSSARSKSSIEVARRPRCPTLTRISPSRDAGGASGRRRRAAGGWSRRRGRRACASRRGSPPPSASSSASQKRCPASTPPTTSNATIPPNPRGSSRRASVVLRVRRRAPGSARARPSGGPRARSASASAFAQCRSIRSWSVGEPPQTEPRLERRHRPAGLDHRVAQPRRRPRRRADDAADQVVVAADVLGRRVHDVVEPERPPGCTGTATRTCCRPRSGRRRRRGTRAERLAGRRR